MIHDPQPNPTESSPNLPDSNPPMDGSTETPVKEQREASGDRFQNLNHLPENKYKDISTQNETEDEIEAMKAEDSMNAGSRFSPADPWFEQMLDEDFKHPAPDEKSCVVGVSGGPDSMALLALLVHYGYQPIVCHVNYQKRPTADRDEQIVRDFCQAHQLEFRLLKPVYETGNFQGWARDVRMDFFDQTARQAGNVPVFLAHQQDDVIETYFLQKKRNILCDFFGIRKITVKKKLRYIRPLLRLSKKDLESFNAAHHIAWGLDESNLSNTYLRNQIRHSQIDRMDESEKERWIKTISKENAALSQRRDQAARKRARTSAAKWLQDADAPFILETWFFDQTGRHLSAAHAQTLCDQLQKNVQISYREWWIERWNDHLFLCRQSLLEPREIVIPSMEALQQMMDLPMVQGVSTWSFRSSGRTIESITVHEEDFPLTLCTVQPGDRISLRYGNKKVSRIFVDQKWSHIRRKSLLLLKNQENRVIFIPGTGCDSTHFSPNPSFYMIES